MYVFRLIALVTVLEKKHENMKAEKAEDIKEQMKCKSYERQVEQMAVEISKIKEENKSLQKR